jgi:hypothetical protein
MQRPANRASTGERATQKFRTADVLGLEGQAHLQAGDRCESRGPDSLVEGLRSPPLVLEVDTDRSAMKRTVHRAHYWPPSLQTAMVLVLPRLKVTEMPWVINAACNETSRFDNAMALSGQSRGIRSRSFKTASVSLA